MRLAWLNEAHKWSWIFVYEWNVLYRLTYEMLDQMYVMYKLMNVYEIIGSNNVWNGKFFTRRITPYVHISKDGWYWKLYYMIYIYIYMKVELKDLMVNYVWKNTQWTDDRVYTTCVYSNESLKFWLVSLMNIYIYIYIYMSGNLSYCSHNVNTCMKWNEMTSN